MMVNALHPESILTADDIVNVIKSCATTSTSTRARRLPYNSQMHSTALGFTLILHNLHHDVGENASEAQSYLNLKHYGAKDNA
jgi:hypothetical protein